MTTAEIICTQKYCFGTVLHKIYVTLVVCSVLLLSLKKVNYSLIDKLIDKFQRFLTIFYLLLNLLPSDIRIPPSHFFREFSNFREYFIYL